MELDKWHRDHLSKYKHLRGGFEVVDEVSDRAFVCMSLLEANDCFHRLFRFQNRLRVRSSDEYCRIDMRHA